MTRILLGEIVAKDGMICLQTHTNTWFPLNGNSAIAEIFRESFSEPTQSDIGRRLYNVDGVMQMENLEQMRARKDSGE